MKHLLITVPSVLMLALLACADVRASENDIEIVLMDGLKNTRKRTSALIIHHLSRALDDTGHLVTLEPTHMEWKRHNHLLRRNPQIVILNRFMFDDVNRIDLDKYERLNFLIDTMRDLDTKFIIYSVDGYPDDKKVMRIKKSVCKTFGAGHCDDRFSFMSLRDTRDDDEFPAATDEVLIEKEIRRLLSLTQSAPESPGQ